MNDLTPNQRVVAKNLSPIGRLLHRVLGNRFVRWLTRSPLRDSQRRASYLLLTDFHRLETWCRDVRTAFGHSTTPYLVGSVNETPDYRDVDVRLILPDRVYDRYFSDVGRVLVIDQAVSSWGQRETGLPIDFQIQRQTEANRDFSGFRNPMGLRDLAMTGRGPGTGRP